MLAIKTTVNMACVVESESIEPYFLSWCMAREFLHLKLNKCYIQALILIFYIYWNHINLTRHNKNIILNLISLSKIHNAFQWGNINALLERCYLNIKFDNILPFVTIWSQLARRMHNFIQFVKRKLCILQTVFWHM